MTTPLRRGRTRWATLLGAAALLAAAVPAAPQPAQAETTDPNLLTVVYDAVGSSHVGAQIDSDLPIGPTTIQVTIDTAAPLPTPIVAGTLAIPPQRIDFKVLGLPARATTTLTQVGQITGTLTKLPSPRQALDLDSTVSYDIRLSDVEVKFLGVWFPLAVGSNCHTIDPVTINASSPLSDSTPPTGFFTINGGGPLTATYTIGQFTGCTPLNLLDIPGFLPTIGSIPVNALVPGSDNTLQLTLSNPRQPGA